VVTGWDREAAEVFGWRAEDAVGCNIVEVALPPEATEAGLAALDALRQGVPWDGELDVLRGDGSVAPVDVQATPIVDAAGEVTGIVAVVSLLRDSARVILARSETRLQLAMEASGITTWEWGDGDGHVSWDANHPAVVGRSFPDGIASFVDFLDLVHPDDRPAVAELTKNAMARGGYDTRFRLVPAEGDVRWVLSRGKVLGEDRRMIGMVADVTSAHTAELALARTFESMADGFITLDADWTMRYVNPAAERIFGRRADELEGHGIWDLFPQVVGSPFWETCQRAVESGQPAELTHRTEPLGRWLEIRAFPGDHQLSVYFHDVTDRAQAQADADAAQARLSFLAEATLVLDSSSDYVATLDQVAGLCIPILGDSCVVDVWEPDGRRSVGVAANDDGLAARLRDLRRKWPDAASSAVPARRTAGNGRPEVFTSFPSSMWEAMAVDEDHLAALLDLGLVSGIVVPLRTRDDVIGAMSLGMVTDRRHSEADVTLAQELGRRAGLAIENARQHAHRASVNRSLQARLLPPTLARVPGLDVAARYVAAGELDVGGDFYDLFQVDETGTWIAAIGDVSGKGAEAAAMTGLLRHTLRAVAPFDDSPSALIAQLNKALLRESGVEQFCTVVVARIQVHDGAVEVTLASGGHPLPMLLAADGTVTSIGRAGSLVGAFPEVTCPHDVLTLQPGEALVLYTDGVTERRLGGRFLGEDGLAEVIAGAVGRRAGGIADTVAAAVAASAQDPATDDMALLVLRARTTALAA
jgi:PAS domain S-box-containing protein